MSRIFLAHQKGVLSVLMAGILFGTIGVFVDYLYSLAPVSAASILFYRFLFACPVLLIVLVHIQRRDAFKVTQANLCIMLGIGACQAFSQLCYFEAIRLTGVSVATLITICVAPVMVALTSSAFLKEPLTRSTLISLGLSLTGVVLLSGVDQPANDLLGRGVLIALASAVAFGAVFIFGRLLAQHSNALQVNAFAISFGTLLLIPFSSPTELTAAFTVSTWWILLYLGLVTTALAYWLLVVGVRSVSATTASVLTLADPLVATLLAILFRGERLDEAGVMGAVLLVAAFLVISRR